MKRYIITLLFICSAYQSWTQDSALGNWMILFGNKDLSPQWNWHHELQYRNYNIVGDLEQLLLRTGLGYDLSPQSNVLIGYGFIRSENYTDLRDKGVVNEHRTYLQWITRQSIRKLRMQHRYRFEQRWVAGDFRLRFRYFLSLNYPLWSDQDQGQEMYLSAYNEIFFNAEGDHFDRNRLYGGIGIRFSEFLRMELGYMNQYFETGGRDQLNIVCFINW